MGKGNFTQRNQPPQARVADVVRAETPVGEPLVTLPAQATLTEERLSELEDLVAALTLRTAPLPRCRCGAFATRLITMDHPIAGMRDCAACDDHEHSDSLARAEICMSKDLPNHVAHRRLNRVLGRAIERANKTIAEAAE